MKDANGFASWGARLPGGPARKPGFPTYKKWHHGRWESASPPAGDLRVCGQVGGTMSVFSVSVSLCFINMFTCIFLDSTFK